MGQSAQARVIICFTHVCMISNRLSISVFQVVGLPLVAMLRSKRYRKALCDALFVSGRSLELVLLHVVLVSGRGRQLRVPCRAHRELPRASFFHCNARNASS